MLGSYIEALTIGVLLAALMFGAGWAVGAIGVRFVEDPAKVKAIRHSITLRARLENALESRREKREIELRQLEGELATHMRRKNQLLQRVSVLNSTQDVWVRVVGEESDAAVRFVAQMSNRYVSASGQKDQKFALVDQSWATPQRIEVWASTVTDARNQLEKRFPQAMGFLLHSIVATNTTDETRTD